MWKYVWVKKCVEMREILFKNWKLLFENINQTPNTSTLKTKNEFFPYLKFCVRIHVFVIVDVLHGSLCNISSHWIATSKYQIGPHSWPIIFLGSPPTSRPIIRHWRSLIAVITFIRSTWRFTMITVYQANLLWS